jgi:zinc protease
LFEAIRVKRGLTYEIDSWFDPREGVGPMGIYTFTRVDKIGETITETLNTYRQFVAGGVTDAEVSEVKALMRGQFPRIFETAEDLGQQLLILERYGISSDYLTGYLQHVDEMTKDQINAAIKKNFDPSNLRILVFAPKDKAVPVLKGLGSVKVVDYQRFL